MGKGMVFNATFNNITVILWRSVLLVEYPEKTTYLPQINDKLYHIMLYQVHYNLGGVSSFQKDALLHLLGDI
jgi:hypothetical protein